MDLMVSPKDHSKSYSPVSVTVTFTEKRVSADVMTFRISAEISLDLGWAGTPMAAVLIRGRKGDLAESQGEPMGRDPAEGQSGAPVSVTLPVTSNNTAALPRDPPFLTLPPISQALPGAIPMFSGAQGPLRNMTSAPHSLQGQERSGSLEVTSGPDGDPAALIAV